METLNVVLGERKYSIHIGPAILEQSDLLLPILRQPKVAVVSNTTIAPLYLQRFTSALHKAGIEVSSIILPDGENYKNWETLNLIFDNLLERRCERSSTLIALGGGVIGDMTGFAAACYQRGMPFIQVPTTLLAQVDSSVGGKTAINHPNGKNMIGAFYQPKLVLADTELLNTLPDRELRSGLVEVIKYGLIRDLPFLQWLEENIELLLKRDPAALKYAILRSCQNKAEVVVADEHENGERALLNLGHTFGHAIETGMGYGQWLHGEAVAIGTMMAAELSKLLGWVAAADVDRIKQLFKRVGVPVCGPVMATEKYLQLMQHDKKVQEGKMRLVLFKQIGQAIVSDIATSGEIGEAIAAHTSHD
ncbi:MAG: 3-dehydroquinate synthase [Betaproteobacteria bacterium]